MSISAERKQELIKEYATKDGGHRFPRGTGLLFCPSVLPI